MQIDNQGQCHANYYFSRTNLKRYAFLDDQLDCVDQSNNQQDNTTHPSSPFAVPQQRRNYDWLLSSEKQEENSSLKSESLSQIEESYQTPSRSLRLSESFNSSCFSYTEWPTPLQKQKKSDKNNIEGSYKPKRLRKHAQLQQNECAICLSQVSNKADLKCGHFYCLQCLQEWLSNSTRCPYCRTEIFQFNCDGQIHKVAQKEFVYEPSNDQVMDWICYRCSHTEEGDIILICDNCGAYACHIECDQTLGGVEPEGEWYCHQCRS